MSNEMIFNLLEEAHRLQGRKLFSEALRALAEVDRLDPGNVQAQVQVGRVLRDQQRLDAALGVFQSLSDEYPESGDIFSELAVTALMADKKEEASKWALRAVEICPESPFCIENLGRVATGLKQWPVAAAQFEKLIAQDKTKSYYFKLLANAYFGMSRMDDAAAAYSKILELEPLTFEHAHKLAYIFFKAFRFAEAADWYKKALGFNARHFSSLFNLSRCFVQLGQMQQALETILEAVKIAPDSASALVHLRELKPDYDFKQNIPLVEKKISTADPDKPETFMREHLFLGKYFHGLKNYKRAFHHFHLYNELRYQNMKKEGTIYNPTLMENNFSETKKVFNPEALERLLKHGSSSDLPVFIIGMPRSGTTLLEQILSSHPLVHGKGEMMALTTIFHHLQHMINLQIDHTVYDIIENKAAEWQKHYLDSLKTPSTAIRATDKMPVNFIYLGIVQTLFPKARILHIRRSPLDTCLSMYSNYFSGVYAYSARLEDLGHYYNLYADLMAYWKKTLKIKFMEVQYEDLVRDSKIKAKEILDFCDLPWNDRVLEFYKIKKSAFTLSQVQVSQPINKSSFARWKPYEEHIQPLIKALNPAVVGPLDMTGDGQ